MRFRCVFCFLPRFFYRMNVESMVYLPGSPWPPFFIGWVFRTTFYLNKGLSSFKRKHRLKKMVVDLLGLPHSANG